MSTLTWTGTDGARAITASATSGDDTTASRPHVSYAGRKSGRGAARTRTRASTPASRSSMASGTVATASHSTPSSTSTRATGTAPCP